MVELVREWRLREVGEPIEILASAIFLLWVACCVAGMICRIQAERMEIKRFKDDHLETRGGRQSGGKEGGKMAEDSRLYPNFSPFSTSLLAASFQQRDDTLLAQYLNAKQWA